MHDFSSGTVHDVRRGACPGDAGAVGDGQVHQRLVPVELRDRDSHLRCGSFCSAASPTATMDSALAERFDFYAMGRTLLREPELPQRISADPSITS